MYSLHKLDGTSPGLCLGTFPSAARAMSAIPENEAGSFIVRLPDGTRVASIVKTPARMKAPEPSPCLVVRAPVFAEVE